MIGFSKLAPLSSFFLNNKSNFSSFLLNSQINQFSTTNFAEFSANQTILAEEPKKKVVKRGKHEHGGSGAAQQQKDKKWDIKNIKKILLVHSAKGGVGKSTVACNLAVALSQIVFDKSKEKGDKIRVGLLDADVHGPSVHTMMGTEEQPEIDYVQNADGTPKILPNGDPDAKMLPNETFGVKVMSIGLVAKEGEAIIWRGPVISGALEQLLSTGVKWGDLDVLVIDLPPGTGDVLLTLAQNLSEQNDTKYSAVIVSTPQTVALNDVARGVAMFDKLKVPILGVVENMSYYQCDCCNKKEYIFGEGGAQKLAKTQNLKFLGEIPIVTKIREDGDNGVPITVQQPESIPAKSFKKIAEVVYHDLFEKPEKM